MKIFFSFLLVLCTFFFAQSSFASGCGWTTEVALGDKTGEQVISGSAQCRFIDVNESQAYCIITPDPSFQVPKMWYYGVSKYQLPDTTQNFSVTVEAYAAMEWDSCEPGDPVPDFVQNGVVYRTTIKDINYEQFVRTARP